jgi:hypothetical protein
VSDVAVIRKGKKMEPCPICNDAMEYSNIGQRDAYAVRCRRCGEYKLTRTALANLRNTYFTLRQRANISGWLRENPEFEISSANIDQLSQLLTPSFHNQADKLLIAMEKDTSYAGDKVEKTPAWLSQGWCVNAEELNEIIDFLRVTNRIVDNRDPNRLFAKIAPEGWAHLESLKRRAPDSTQCFVAMWFTDEMMDVYDNIIAPAILDAGYKPHRVDLREHNEKIDDEIIAQIRQSRFILADFTGHRGGVYFEAGFAKGLNLEVIWTCSEDDLENLHFDIRQYNCITWSHANLGELKRKIKNRIEAVLGHGTYQKVIA